MLLGATVNNNLLKKTNMGLTNQTDLEIFKGLKSKSNKWYNWVTTQIFFGLFYKNFGFLFPVGSASTPLKKNVFKITNTI